MAAFNSNFMEERKHSESHVFIACLLGAKLGLNYITTMILIILTKNVILLLLLTSVHLICYSKSFLMSAICSNETPKLKIT